MGRKPKRCVKKCPKHTFLLKPVHYSAVFSRELQACFCPANWNRPSITPRFNKDRRAHTTSFLLPVDRRELEMKQEQYRIDHENYKVENEHQKSNIMVAKPRSKNCCCSICKEDYDDYLDVKTFPTQHIQSDNHKKNIKNNRFDQFINELCQDVSKKQMECEMKQEETKLGLCSDTSLPLWEHEVDQRQNEGKYNSYLSMFEHKEINDWLFFGGSFKSPGQICNSVGPQQVEKDDKGGLLPPSPLKKYSEATSFMKVRPNQKIDKPIIICGVKCSLNSQVQQ